MPKLDQAKGPPSVALHHVADVEAMVALLADALAEACPQARTVVLLRKGDNLVPVHVSGEEEPPTDLVVALTGSFGERLRTGAPLSVADYRGDVIRALGGHRIVPCMGRQGVQAAVVSDAPDKDKGYWSLLREMAPHVGLVHERLLAPAVFRPSPPGAAPRTRLFELSLEFGGLATLPQTATIVAGALREALEAASCVLYWYDAGAQSLRLVGAVGMRDEDLERRVAQGRDGLPEQTLLEGRGGVLGDVLRSGEGSLRALHVNLIWPEPPRDGFHLFLPLSHGDRVMGVVGLSVPTDTPALRQAEEVLADLLVRGAIALSRASRLEPMLLDPHYGLPDGRLVEGRLLETCVRARDAGVKVCALSMRFGESATHRGESAPAAPPIDQIIDELADFADVARESLGYMGHGRFVGIMEGMSAESARKVLGGLFDALKAVRGELSVHSVAIVECREGEGWETTWQRAHTHCAKRYDDGPGLHVTVSGLVRERAETL